MASTRLLVVVAFAALPFLAFGASVLWFSWRRITQWQADRDRFETVQASVTNAEPTPVEDQQGIYRATLSVEYTFRGRTYEAAPQTNVDPPTGTEENVRDFLDSLSSGRVTVHVDPETPDSPVLMARDRPPIRAFALAVVGLASLGVGVGSLVIAVLAVLGVVG